MIVLDASALVDVLVDQPEGPWVLDQLEGQELCAPAHQTAEVLSALARLRRAGLLDPDAQGQAVEEALALPQELVLPMERHLHRALALQDRIRVLDGLYIALAEERVCALVSTDRRLWRAVAGCDIRTPPPE